MFAKLKAWMHKTKIDLIAVFLASRDNRTPRLAKVVAITVAAYALSPIDLIPDFIPVLGYLDDLILVPAGIALVVRLIPAPLITEFRVNAKQWTHTDTNWIMGGFIIVLWLITIAHSANTHFQYSKLLPTANRQWPFQHDDLSLLMATTQITLTPQNGTINRIYKKKVYETIRYYFALSNVRQDTSNTSISIYGSNFFTEKLSAGVRLTQFSTSNNSDTDSIGVGVNFRF